MTSTIVFEDDGVREYVAATTTGSASEPRRPRPPSPQLWSRARRLLGQSPQALVQGTSRARNSARHIEQLEAEIAQLHAEMANPQFYQQPGDKIAKAQAHLADKEAKLTHSYSRWEELEASQSASALAVCNVPLGLYRLGPRFALYALFPSGSF